MVEASSGGGAVTVKMNGKKEVLKVTIDPAAVTSLSGPTADVEMLEDLITAAFNEAGRRAEEILKSSMQGDAGRPESAGRIDIGTTFTGPGRNVRALALHKG